MKYLVSLLLISLSLLTAACTQKDSETRLIVLSTTDLHGHVFAWDFYADAPDDKHSMLKAATVVDSIRAIHNHTLLLDAGDWLQGNPFAEYYARTDSTASYPLLIAAEAMGYDAFTIGNHEFNFGIDILNRRISESSIDFIAANITQTSTAELAYTPYIIKEVDGFSVAIIGLTTPGSAIWDRPRVEGRLTFGDGVEAAQKYVDEVRERGAEVVIILAHTGVGPGSSYTSEHVPEENFGTRLVDEVEGIHLLIAGHTHRQVDDITLTSEKNPQGVPVVMAGRWGSHVGYAEMVLKRSENGVLVRIDNTQLIAVEPYSMKASLVTELNDAFEAVRSHINEPVATTIASWSAEHARLQDSPITDLIQHIQHQVTGADISLASVFDVSATLGPGPISRGDLARLYPYENTLFKKRISGRDLKSLLEFSARYYETTPSGETPKSAGITPGYNFDVASGVTYEIDLSQQVGSRIKNLRFKNQAVRDNQTFTLAVNSYRAVGGGDYDMIANAETVQEYDTSVRKLMEIYLMEKGSIEPDEVHQVNWRILNLPEH